MVNPNAAGASLVTAHPPLSQNMESGLFRGVEGGDYVIMIRKIRMEM
jgi:hypothetical protein